MKATFGVRDGVEYIRVEMEDGKQVVHRPATDEDRQRFGGAYAAFKGPAVKAHEPAPARPALSKMETPDLPGKILKRK